MSRRPHECFAVSNLRTRVRPARIRIPFRAVWSEGRLFAAVMVWVGGLTACAGCAVGPNYRTPSPTTMPTAWSHPEEHGPLPDAAPTTQPASLADWWRALNDPTLDSLIVRAVQSNLDLKVAEARVREARTLRGVAMASLFPTVNASGSYAYKGTSDNATPKAKSSSSGNGGVFGTIGKIGSLFPSITIKPGDATNPPTITVNPPKGSGSSSSSGGTTGASVTRDRDQNLYQTGFDATWELDVFGGIRRSVEAADADIAAAQENQRDVLVTLLAEVARNYVELRGIQRRLTITRENIASQTETLKLTESRFKAGLTGELDVVRAQAQLSSTTSQIPALESDLQAAVHRMGVLLAQSPDGLWQELSRSAPIPASPPDLPLGMPSDLLRRRPDIRQAERELAATTARIGVATADLFPKFSLTGSFGLQSAESNKLFDKNSTYWSVGPGMRWPIFDGGRIRANIEAHNARQEQAAARYENVVLTALAEVENALIAYMQEKVRYRELTEAVAANRRAVELASELYGKGLTDFLTVLQAQSALFLSQDQSIQSERTVIVSLVSLYKSLGGGWDANGTPQVAVNRQ